MRGSERHPGVQSLHDMNANSVGGLRSRMSGQVVTHCDAGYHDARKVWNGLINRYPAVIARCDGVADVVEAVSFAREHDLPVTVRGGGHNVAGTAVDDGCLVVDLSLMKGVLVDPEKRRVRVEPGARLGELNRETQCYGLATPGGMAADTGVSGSTLSGGIGWLRRKHGLGVDNLRSAQVVLADGDVVTASEESNPDLFWAIRGGGGNFGVVTSFEFELHPVGPDVARAILYYAGDDAGEVLRSYRQYTSDASDEVTTLAFLTFASHSSSIPRSHRGEPALGIMGCYAGPVAEGERALRPLREFGDPITDHSGVTTFVDLHDSEDTYPHGRNYYWKSLYLRELRDDCIDQLVERARAAPSKQSSVALWQLGGAMGRVDPSATAFPARNEAFLLTVEATWDDPARSGENLAWARETWSEMEEFSPGTLYVNFPGFAEEGDDLLRTAYGPNYDRLVELKSRYDPTNVFRPGQKLDLSVATS